MHLFTKRAAQIVLGIITKIAQPHTDFLLTLIKSRLVAKLPLPRIILMSATSEEKG